MPDRHDDDEAVGPVAQHSVAVPRDAVVAVAVEVAPHRADRDAVALADRGRHGVDVGQVEALAEREAGGAAGLLEHPVVHRDLGTVPRQRLEQLVEHRVRAREPRRLVVEPRPLVEVVRGRARGTTSPRSGRPRRGEKTGRTCVRYYHGRTVAFPEISERVGIAWGSPRTVGARRRGPRLGDGLPRRHDRQRRAPDDRPRTCDADLADLQWVLDAYLVTLTALLLLGGRARRPVRPSSSVHDRRRVRSQRRRRCAGSRRRPARSSRPGPCRESVPRCSCPAAWRCSRRRSARRIAPGDRCVVGAHGRRERGGALRRRMARRRRVLAVGVPHQPAARRRRAVRRASRARERRSRRAARISTCSGATIVALGLASLTAGLIEAGGGWTAPDHRAR